MLRARVNAWHRSVNEMQRFNMINKSNKKEVQSNKVEAMIIPPINYTGGSQQ